MSFRALAAVGVLQISSSMAVGQQNDGHVAHIASYRSLEAAKNGIEQLRVLMPEIFRTSKHFIHEVELGGQGTWYRVQIGPPSSESSMQGLCEALRQAGHAYCKVMTAHEVGRTTPGHSGDLILKPVGDARSMEVTQKIEYVDRQGRRWTVPAGSRTDGASIPRVLWTIVGSPFTGTYLRAAVIHDRYVATRHRSWMDTHDVFYDVMLADGTDRRHALMMWAAVYRFGPRWSKSESTCWDSCSGSNILLDNVTITPDFVADEFERIKSALASQPAIAKDALKAFIDEKTFYRSDVTYGATLRGFISGTMTEPGIPTTRREGYQYGSSERRFVEGRAPMNWSNMGGVYADFVKPTYEVTGVRSGDSLKLRSGPGAQYQIVGEIRLGVKNIVIVGECDKIWCRIRSGNLEGWANTSFLSIDWNSSGRR